MSKTQLKISQSSINDENIPYNSQHCTSAVLSKTLKPEEGVISYKEENKEEDIEELACIVDTENAVTEKDEEYQEAVEKDETAVEEEALKEDNAVGCFSEPVYRGDGFHCNLNFKDEECGEPLRDQHLRIDFSPIEGVDDNEFIIQKCNDFWKMIEENPSIHGLRASPESYYNKGLARSSFSKHTKNVEPTAMGWLKQGPEFISQAFTTENKKMYCEDTKDTCSDWAMKKETEKDFELPVVSMTAHRSFSRKSRVKASSFYTLSDASTLCRQMDEWDFSHPKSMEPPGHPPKFTHAVMLLNQYNI